GGPFLHAGFELRVEPPQLFGALALGALGAYAGGDIVGEREDDAPSIERHDMAGDLDVDGAAVLATVLPDAGVGEPRIGAPQVPPEALGLLGRADVGEGHLLEFLARPAVVPHRGLVDVEH